MLIILLLACQALYIKLTIEEYYILCLIDWSLVSSTETFFFIYILTFELTCSNIILIILLIEFRYVLS